MSHIATPVRGGEQSGGQSHWDKIVLRWGTTRHVYEGGAKFEYVACPCLLSKRTNMSQRKVLDWPTWESKTCGHIQLNARCLSSQDVMVNAMRDEWKLATAAVAMPRGRHRGDTQPGSNTHTWIFCVTYKQLIGSSGLTHSNVGQFENTSKTK